MENQVQWLSSFAGILSIAGKLRLWILLKYQQSKYEVLSTNTWERKPQINSNWSTLFHKFLQILKMETSLEDSAEPHWPFFFLLQSAC